MNIKRKFKIRIRNAVKLFPYIETSNSTGTYFRGTTSSNEKRAINHFKQLLMRAKKHAISVPKGLKTEEEFWNWLQGA